MATSHVTDEELSAALAEAASAFQARRSSLLPAEVASALPAAGQVMRGLIATGDVFVSSNEERAAVMEAVPEALCVEMEGASVAQVAHAYGVPVAVVRVISDKADGDAATLLMTALGSFAGAYAGGVVGPVLRG